jgi:uncharacterized membrane protein YeaQ/YmgE (transglycosylase-associated protein family)
MSLSTMGWLAWVILGGVAGWIASMMTKNNKRMGILANIIVGILGAFAGTFILNLAGVQGMTGFNMYTFLVAIGGAIVLLFLFNVIRGRK